MSATIRCVKYFYVMLEDRPGQGCMLLSQLAQADVNLLAFSAVPAGPSLTQLIVYPESPEKLVRMAEKNALVMTGPHKAFLINGDEKLGALVEIHRKLWDASINVVTSSGVTDGRDGYGYILHVRPEDYNEVAHLLGAID